MRLTGEIMKIITCFKLVPEEQDGDAANLLI